MSESAEKATMTAQETATTSPQEATGTADTPPQPIPNTGSGKIGLDPDHIIENQSDLENLPPDGFEFKPLFEGEEVFSEAQLKGGEEPTGEEKKEEKASSTEQASDKDAATATSKPEDDKKKAGDKEGGDKADAEGTGDKPKEGEDKEKLAAEDKKPPEGYVEIRALHKERDKRKVLGDEVAQLRWQVIQLNQALAQAQEKGDETSTGDDDLEVLSEEEFKELAEDDPTEATIYLKRLGEHKEKQGKIKAQLSHENAIIDQAWRNIGDAIPDFFDVEKPIRNDLTAFALKTLGISNNDLTTLTSPGTLVMAPGEKNLRVLGHGAAEFIKMVHQLQKNQPGALKETLRAELKAEHEKDLEAKLKEQREQLQKELFEKIKNPNSGAEEYRSIGEGPGSGEQPSNRGFLNEAQWAKLPESERVRLLSGA